MASAQVVETSVNSPFQDSNHKDDLFQSRSNVLIANVAAVGLLTATVIIPGDIGRHVCERMGLCHVSPTTKLLHSILVHYVSQLLQLRCLS